MARQEVDGQSQVTVLLGPALLFTNVLVIRDQVWFSIQPPLSVKIFVQVYFNCSLYNAENTHPDIPSNVEVLLKMQNLFLSLQSVDDSHHKKWSIVLVSTMYQLIFMKDIFCKETKYQSTHLIPTENNVGCGMVLVEVQSGFITLLFPKSGNLSKFNK